MNKPIIWADDQLPTEPARELERLLRGAVVVRGEVELRQTLPAATCAILHVPHARLKDLQLTVAGIRRVPILWLCTEHRVPRDLEWGYTLDGLLFPSMNRHEIEWALQWGSRTHLERRRWHEEKEQLMQRLEERKWIDQAKGILCEIKGISESEAYDFLRKQAMNERKRIGDVAASIVKVYQLIHG